MKVDIDYDLNGVSDWRGNRLFILLYSRIQSCSHQSFSLAYEIGYIIIHSLADDVAFENLEQNRILDSQANRFEQAFLFSAKAYSREIPSFRI